LARMRFFSSLLGHAIERHALWLSQAGMEPAYWNSEAAAMRSPNLYRNSISKQKCALSLFAKMDSARTRPALTSNLVR
ncbi:hypothetical protein, partial [Xanthomonas graminis]|uniref:hypothetical protein n=1 Tax=Xanthomonas graminis TaxID=3390026 RepID=UPI001BB05738